MARIGAEALIQRMIIKTSINEDSKTLIETLNRQAFTINIIFRVDGCFDFGGIARFHLVLLHNFMCLH